MMDVYILLGIKWDGRIEIAVELGSGISGEEALNFDQL